ncbi:GyrI-like domain-containing protein [Streptomyces sp. NPDC001941]|uniref:GyrI-like domain-containing protein n=1 Tax=Streptomyces sp. NPDC001941 TaxID=3154659 RepID=UPI00332F4A3E
MSNQGPDPTGGAEEPRLVRLAPATTAVVRDVVAPAELRAFFDTSFGALARTLASQQLAVAGPAFGLYHGVPGESVDLEVGFVTDRPVAAEGSVVPGSLPGGRVARLTHHGSFDTLGASWERLRGWMREQGLTAGEDLWEVYVTQPTPDMDPADLRTELNWPVAD